MRRQLCALMSIIVIVSLLVPTVSADDIVLFLDNQPLPDSYELVPGSVLDTGITVGEGILITRVDILTDNNAIKEFANQLIPKEFDRPLEQHTKHMQIPLPSKLPTSSDDVGIKISYLDKDFSEHVFERHIQLSVTQGTWWMTALSTITRSQTAVELANALGHAQLSRLDPELRPEDVTKEDLDALEITPAQYFDGLKMLRDAAELEKKGDTKKANQFRLEAGKLLPQPTKKGTSSESKTLSDVASKNTYLAQMSGAFTPLVTTSKNVYTVEHGGKSITKSKVVISVPAEDRTISNVDLVAVIPKEAASDVSELSFSEEPEILEADPVVKWAFQNIPQGQIKDYSYTVNADAHNFETLAAATAEKPSLLYRFIMWVLSKTGAI